MSSLGFHPHPDLLPSREKELWIVIARSVLCDVAISFHTFLNNEKMRSSRLQKAKPQDDGWKAPSPPRKRHPSTEGNCSTSSPIEGGFRGVCLSIFCFITFLLILVFSGQTIMLHSQRQLGMKIDNSLTYTSPHQERGKKEKNGLPTRGEGKRIRSFSLDGRRRR